MPALNWRKKKGEKESKGKVREIHIIIGEGKDGGHAVHVIHHGTKSEPYPESEKTHFGADQGEEAMMHIAKHAGIEPGGEKEST